jgi:hypothetical protein
MKRFALPGWIMALTLCMIISATPALAEVEELKAEIRALAAKVERYEARIAALEREVANLRESLGPADTVNKSAKGKAPTGPQGWKNKANWRRIKSGMSPSQVQGILGSPTHREGQLDNIGSWRYEGYVNGVGQLSGNVSFLHNQVLLVSEPVFE